MSKHKDPKMMMRNPDHIQAEDIAQYAIFSTKVNDNDQFRIISDLIAVYGNALYNQGIAQGEKQATINQPTAAV